VKWRVSSDTANTQRISISAPTRWPTEADPAGAFQLDIMGGGATGAEPAVSRILFTEAQATDAGGKLQAGREGFTTVLYTEGDNPAVGIRPALVQAVKHQRWQTLVSGSTPAIIGTEITFAQHEDTQKNGYVVNVAARYDGDAVAPAYNRDSREGPIIPVNTDEPSTEIDDMVILCIS
jgi:hypothetical protein